jgi:beta-phosphoglucomutase-like phosphatase (HAD superfamily)
MIEHANAIVSKLENDSRKYAVVSNPSYVYPQEEYYPLAPALEQVDQLSGVLMDMDGTTTSTEELCIYALEQMVRRMSGKMNPNFWQGLDRENDYPHIIGNSTTKHVEYLIGKYEGMLDPKHTAEAFVNAAVWTLKQGRDEKRKQELIQNLRKLGMKDLINDALQYEKETKPSQDSETRMAGLSFDQKVSVGIDIYYHVYHEILARLKQGRSEEIKQEVFGHLPEDKHLIAPMPGIPILLPLLKGWLGSSVSLIAEELLEDYQQKTGHRLSRDEQSDYLRQLTQLSLHFARYPVKVGLVTSSIHYEADIVIQEVFDVIRSFYEKSSLPESRKKKLLKNLSDYREFYDAFVTASDSSEIRLKPHRDLYSIALHQLGLMPGQFDQVIGFEDSQSGTVAIRAAGIGCCVAVPFAQTSEHNFEAAVHVLKGGIPQALIEHKLFVNQEVKQTSNYE